MTFQLPQAVGGSATGWALADYRQISYVSGKATAGTMTATADQLDTAELWLIDRAVVYTTSTAATALRLYTGAVAPGRLLSGSASGNFDEADYPQGLLIPAGGQLLAVWTGADNNAIGTVNLQVRVLRQVSA
jgi:hypothetical protein